MMVLSFNSFSFSTALLPRTLLVPLQSAIALTSMHHHQIQTVLMTKIMTKINLLSTLRTP